MSALPAAPMTHDEGDDLTPTPALARIERARLRARHLVSVARFCEAGVFIPLTPAQLRDTAQLLMDLADDLSVDADTWPTE